MAKKIALLIGVSQYPLSDLSPLPAAAKDVEAVERVLLHPQMGGFSKVETLIDYSTQEIRSAIEECFEERDPDDLILLYYSGHGIKDEDGKLFFAAHDTKTYHQKLRKSSAIADYDIYEAMNQSRAKQQIILLDCCFSGAFDPNRVAKSQTGLTEVDLKPLDAFGRVVLTSSSSTEYSFGDPAQGLSIYTRFLVEGIESGEADRDRDGIIRIQELHDYAKEKVQKVEPRMQPRIRVVKDEAYNIIIANRRSHPEKEVETPLKLHPREWNAIVLGNKTSIRSQDHVPLQSFLEPFEALTTELIERLNDDQWIAQLLDYQQVHSLEVVHPVLSVIRATSKADVVFVLQQQTPEENDAAQQWSVVSYSDADVEASQASYFDALKSKILPTVSYQDLSSAYHHGMRVTHEDQQFVLIPVRSELAASASLPQLMIVCQPRLETALMGNIYGQILTSFYQACHLILPKAFPREAAIALIEAGVLDGLKQAFGFVSAQLYDRRFQLFRDRLQRMVVHFEPILQLDDLDIFGWEALARDPLPTNRNALSAPVDLFKAAELWGTRFTTELDLHFLWTAIESYRVQCREAKLNRPADIRRLSVNVYPDTLMRTAYREALRRIIKVDKLITGRKLTLEISEKAALPQSESRGAAEPHWKAFRHAIEKYVHDFDVQFAIDDFGVGYASVSRLVGLNPTYVKIDQEILLTKSQDIINLVASFVRELLIKSGNSNSFVIVEGIEADSQIDLRSLREMKVSHIQGYLVGKAKAEIQARLDQAEYEEFLRRLEQA